MLWRRSRPTRKPTRKSQLGKTRDARTWIKLNLGVNEELNWRTITSCGAASTAFAGFSTAGAAAGTTTGAAAGGATGISSGTRTSGGKTTTGCGSCSSAIKTWRRKNPLNWRLHLNWTKSLTHEFINTEIHSRGRLLNTRLKIQLWRVIGQKIRPVLPEWALGIVSCSYISHFDIEISLIWNAIRHINKRNATNYIPHISVLISIVQEKVTISLNSVTGKTSIISLRQLSRLRVNS